MIACLDSAAVKHSSHCDLLSPQLQLQPKFSEELRHVGKHAFSCEREGGLLFAEHGTLVRIRRGKSVYLRQVYRATAQDLEQLYQGSTLSLRGKGCCKLLAECDDGSQYERQIWVDVSPAASSMLPVKGEHAAYQPTNSGASFRPSPPGGEQAS